MAPDELKPLEWVGTSKADLREMDLIRQRLKDAEQHYRANYGGR